ncbi:MAG TPA: hypothetical protein VLJ79_09320 [Candidatus Binatia bacterium]|nr:hypothetical protein [Candidatus Binatia bacterium]
MLLLPKSIVGVQPYVEWRRHEGKVDRLPALATELVRLKVDVIVVTGVGDLCSPLSWIAIPLEVVSSPVWRKTHRC